MPQPFNLYNFKAAYAFSTLTNLHYYSLSSWPKQCVWWAAGASLVCFLSRILLAFCVGDWVLYNLLGGTYGLVIRDQVPWLCWKYFWTSYKVEIKFMKTSTVIAGRLLHIKKNLLSLWNSGINLIFFLMLIRLNRTHFFLFLIDMDYCVFHFDILHEKVLL